MMWRKEDPRDIIDKRGEIVIVGPNFASRASVDTKHTYCIFLHDRRSDEREMVYEAEDWPDDWTWTVHP